MATAKDTPKLFISYARHDTRVRDVVNALMKSGIVCWTDEAIRAGASWQDEIERALRDCSALVLCISPSFLSSDWSMLEMGFALSRANEPEFSLIPLLLEDVLMPAALKRLKAIDGRKLSASEIADNIIRSVGGAPARNVTVELKRLAVASQRHMRQHNWEMAKSTLTDAILACQQIGDRKTQASLCCNLGLVYERLGNIARATSLHQQALEIDTHLGYEEGIANHLFNLGRLISDTDSDNAREYFDRARQLYEKLALVDRVSDVEGWLTRITKR